MWLCRMWVFVLSCVSAVAGIPVNLTQGVTTPTPVHVLYPNNETSTTVASVLSNNETAETLAELEVDMASEGDLLLLEDRNAIKKLWADGVVPYTIGAELGPRKADIAAAFSMISDSSCIQFKEHTNELNYLNIKDGKGCASHVGCVGGAQPVYFASSCSVGNLCHELMHAMGLYHEHTRMDRDQYVTVIWETIKSGKKSNFDVKDGDTQNLPYDFESIMHYGSSFFSKDGSPTIVPKQEGVNVGQRKRLSQFDTQRLNKLYKCGGSQTKG